MTEDDDKEWLQATPEPQPWAVEYLKMIEDCESRDRRMNEWEREFIDSLKTQIRRGKVPSAKQIEALDRTWEKATAKG